MKKHLKYIIVIFLLLWPGLSIWAWDQEEFSSSPYSEAIQAFEHYVKEQMQTDKVPGLSVGFLKDDFSWAKGFGYSDMENMVPAKAESSYRLASITKTMTAIAILQLVETGIIDLDKKVQIYVPYFPKKNWPVTVRLLLGHLGGISHYKDYDKETHIKVHKNTREAVAIFKDFDLITEPGTKYTYSSYGYNLLGAVIEEATGKSYGDFIGKHILYPLGMTNSCLDDPDDIIPNRVRGYRLVNGEIKNSEYVNVSSRFASGGIRSTVVDLLKYARGIIERKLLKEETWRQMFTSMILHNGHFTEYGMGWRIHPWRGHFQVYHGGSQPETRTYLIIFPNEYFAIAIASNRESLNLMPYINRLAELVLDEDLDSTAYVRDKEGLTIYDACHTTFSHGLSEFHWKKIPAASGEEDLAQAFSYFNQNVNEKALKRNFKDTTKEINDGIHPVAKEAFTKVGIYMASVLEEAYGKNGIKSYHKSGPLAFFNDYIQLSNKWPQDKKRYTFSNNFSRLISRWVKEWNATYTDYIRHLSISIHTDFEELGNILRETYSKSHIYPDFHNDMATVARYFLEKDKPEMTFKISHLSAELYPGTVAPLSGLAAAHIWTGNAEKARELYRQAAELDPEHPSLHLNEFKRLANILLYKNKIQELLLLAEIAAELYYKNAVLQKDVGDAFFQFGKKDKAIYYYKKALELNPKFKEAEERLSKLLKEKRQK